MKQWSIAKLNKDNAGTISDKYELPSIISALLDIRGITTEEDIRNFLFNETDIEDPFSLKDMDKAVLRIKQAIDNGEKICVYGDFDADGVTSTSLLYSYLDTVGADVTYYIPSRETEGYGMHISSVDKLKERNVELLITVDNGISAVDEIAYAKSLGIDTVVTDHHMPSDTLPDAVAVVDPHRADCKSAYKTISGVGVAFKLVCALEGEYCDIDMLLDNYSDLVCIGTIGDIMPLTKDNRVFVKRGLKSINNSDRVGINSLNAVAGLSDKDIQVSNVSFAIVPRINAAGRLGLSNYSVTLLTTDDSDDSDRIASKLGDDNSERQRIEKEIISDINEKIKRNPSLINDRIIVIDGDNWHHGVIGIVSARIKDIYGKPCIIISRCGEVCRGSGRSIAGFDLWEAVSSCADILTHFGGHPMAVGLTLNEEDIETVRVKVNEYAVMKGEMPFDKLKIDIKLNPDILDVEIAKNLKYLAPFGTGNPVPVFQLSNLKIINITPVSGDKHLRFTFASGQNRISAMLFYTPSAKNQFVVGDTVDAAVNLDVNSYKNNESLSVVIKALKFSGVDYSDYIRTQRIFESFLRGEKLSKKTLLEIIPTRTDFADIYRYLRSIKSSDNMQTDILVHRINTNITYGKLKVALLAMKQLGLIEYTEELKKSSFRVLNVSHKVSLEKAPVIQRLKEVYQSE